MLGASDQIAAVLAFQRSRLTRAAELIEPVPGIDGAVALFCPSLPRVWSLNTIVVTVLPDGSGLPQLFDACDRVQGSSGLAHRRLRVLEGADEPAFRAEAEARGWRVDHDLVMILDGTAVRPAAPGRVSDIDRAALDVAASIMWSQDPDGRDPEIRRQLVDQYDRWDQSAPIARRLGVVEDGQVVAWCRLFGDGQIAEIDDVNVLLAQRGLGLGRMVMEAAIAAVPADQLVFLCADPEDWPRRMYERLGFEPAGRILGATRVP